MRAPPGGRAAQHGATGRRATALFLSCFSNARATCKHADDDLLLFNRLKVAAATCWRPVGQHAKQQRIAAARETVETRTQWRRRKVHKFNKASLGSLICMRRLPLEMMRRQSATCGKWQSAASCSAARVTLAAGRRSFLLPSQLQPPPPLGLPDESGKSRADCSHRLRPTCFIIIITITRAKERERESRGGSSGRARLARQKQQGSSIRPTATSFRAGRR